MAQARASTDQFQNGVLNSQAALLKVGAAATAVGALTTRALVGMGNESARFSAEVTKLTTQVGIARSEALGLATAATALGIAAGKGPQEMAEALFFVTSAGLRGADALAAVDASAKASAVGLGDTATVADLVTSAMNAYGSEVLSATAATDVLIGAVREGKAEAPQLAGALGRVLPIASEMGVTFDQVGAAVAAMTRTGTDAATATTQLRAMLQSLLNPAQGVERAMERLGLSSQQLRDVIRRDGLWAALMMMRDAIGDNEQAIGELFPNQRALLGFLDLTGANAAENALIFDRLSDSTGNLAAAVGEWSLTTEASQQRFSAAMAKARISLGEDLEPSMRAVLDTGTGLALMFDELPDSVRGAGLAFAGVGGALATIAGSGALAIVGFAHLRSAMQNLGLTAGSLLRFTFHPLTIGIGILATALLGAANAKAELHRRAEVLRTVLGEEIALVKENTDAWQRLSDVTRRGVAEHLIREHDNLIDVLDETGVSLDDVAGALLGNEAAYQRVNAAIAEHSEAVTVGKEGTVQLTGAGQELARILGIEEKALLEAIRIHEALSDVKGEGADVTDELAGEIDALGDEFVEMASDVDLATEALRNHLDEQRAATDPLFNLTRSLRDQAEAQDAVTEARDEFGEGSPQHLQALEDLVRKNLDVEAAFAAVAEHGLEPMIAALDQMVEQGHISRADADLLIAKFKEAEAAGEDFAGEYLAELLAEVDEAKLAEAEAELEALRAERRAEIIPQIHGGQQRDTEGALDELATPRTSQFLPEVDRLSEVRVGVALEDLAKTRSPEYMAELNRRSQQQVGRSLDDLAGTRSPQYRAQVDAGARSRTNTSLNRLAQRRSPSYRPRVDSASRRSAETSLNNLARGRTAVVRVTTSGAGLVSSTLGRLAGGNVHTGGRITSSGIKRFHDGGHVRRYHDGGSVGGLRPDEVPAILQTGELVLSRQQTAVFDQASSAMGRLARMMGNTAQSGPFFHNGGAVSGTGAGGSGMGQVQMPRELVVRDINGQLVGRMRVEAAGVMRGATRTADLYGRAG